MSYFIRLTPTKAEMKLFFCGKKIIAFNLKNFFFDCRENIWSILSSQSTEHTPSIALHDVKEIETWILRLLSAPVPVPGSTRIECELLSASIHESLLFALPDHTRFSLVDFPLHLPLELLGKFNFHLIRGNQLVRF